MREIITSSNDVEVEVQSHRFEARGKKKEKEEGGVVPMGERRLHGSNLITFRKMVKQEEI